MSSAALQTAPQQPAALASPPLTSPTNRQFLPSHSSSSREAYYANQNITNSSPSSQRPSSRKSGSQGVPPSGDARATAAARSPAVSAFSPYANSSPSDRHIVDMAPVAPPRISSTQQNASSRRSNYTNEASYNSPRHAHPDSSRTDIRSTQNDSSDNFQTSRTGSSHMHQHDSPARQSQTRDGRGSSTTIPIRNHPGDGAKQPQDANESLMRAMTTAEEPNGRDVAKPQQSSKSRQDDVAPPPAAISGNSQEDKRSQKTRQDHSKTHHKTSKFGDFILGNTIGEGEFGKVKLGWKQDSTVQVAIKLIKRETVGSNPFRLAKIRREVTILRGLNHPNIVRLFDMVETDRYIGIVLEYASGGELFDYILNHRYLKDNSARRLFSQLVSGVGYLHKKGIVHRDLKLENLLLDRNRNIIITDFGFANTFDPHEELNEEEELNLQDRDQVKRLGLDKVKPNGMRRGDLMQTSCGSPCYAAPELVVSDSLYTGRKVDVWSCGVILYAMLAGYLPFDDDPANPEGDNINLLYKYIVSTRLIFPDYVTPHARDLLRRILVPNPRKRADLFEVARHSWLSEYSHVVEFITSSATSPSDIQDAATSHNDFMEAPMVTRSASVRESSKSKSPQSATVGGLSKTHNKLDTTVDNTHRTPKDTKRRTVQVEYVAPSPQAQHGAQDLTPPRGQSATTGRDGANVTRTVSGGDKPLPNDPPVSRETYAKSGQARGPPVSHNTARGTRDSRTYTENTHAPGAGANVRPHTGGSMQSAGSLGLQSRVVNYGQPAPPAIADTNAQGRIQQPSSADEEALMGRTSGSIPPKFAQVSGFHDGRLRAETKGHKRSSTIGDISTKLLGRNGSVFGRKGKRLEQQSEKSKKYPPVSLSSTMLGGEEQGRQSTDSRMSGSRRSFSLGLGRKPSGSMAESQDSSEKKQRRRFSLLPASFSLKAIGLGKENNQRPPSEMESQLDLPHPDVRKEQVRSFTAPGDARGTTPFFDDFPDASIHGETTSSPAQHQRYRSVQLHNQAPASAPRNFAQQSSQFNSESDTSMDMRRPPTEPQLGSYRHDFADSGGLDGRRVGKSGTNRPARGVLTKNNKRFTDAYDQSEYHGHEGSSGAAKRVMDFFRRRGKARSGDER